MGNQNEKPVQHLTDEDVTDFIKTSGLDEVYVREEFKSFMNDHPDGTMKQADFDQMIKTTYPSIDASKLGKYVFRLYDTNHDGVIDFTEFMAINQIMSSGTSEEVLEKIFNVFDRNHDGRISKKEMGRMVKGLYSLIKHDNPGVGPKEVIVNSAFREMDHDADGEVTLEEFTKACLEKGQTSKMLALKFINIFAEEEEEEE